MNHEITIDSRPNMCDICLEDKNPSIELKNCERGTAIDLCESCIDEFYPQWTEYPKSFIG